MLVFWLCSLGCCCERLWEIQSSSWVQQVVTEREAASCMQDDVVDSSSWADSWLCVWLTDTWHANESVDSNIAGTKLPKKDSERFVKRDVMRQASESFLLYLCISTTYSLLSSLARDLASHSTLWYQRIMVAWHPSSLQPKRRLANNQRNPHKTIGFLNLSNTVDTIIHVHAEKSGFFNCNCKGKGKEGNSGEWIGMHEQIYIYYNQHQEFKLFKIMRNLVAVART